MLAFNIRSEINDVHAPSFQISIKGQFLKHGRGGRTKQAGTGYVAG